MKRLTSKEAIKLSAKEAGIRAVVVFRDRIPSDQ